MRGDGGETNVYSIAAVEQHRRLGRRLVARPTPTSTPKDTRSMTSSVAGSNFGSIAVSDINNPEQAKSNFLIPNRFTMQHFVGARWFARLHDPRLAVRRTLPVAPVLLHLRGRRHGRHLGRQQRGPAPPLRADRPDRSERAVLLRHARQPACRTTTLCGGAATNFDTTDFFAWADAVGLAARRANRAATTSKAAGTTSSISRSSRSSPPASARARRSWSSRTSATCSNDEWGVLYESPFPQRVGVVEIDRDAGTNRFIYRRLASSRTSTIRWTASSFWTVKVGASWGF